MKIAVNKCFGGFSFSTLGICEYLKRKGRQGYCYKQTKHKHIDGIDEYTKVEPSANSGLWEYVSDKDYGCRINELDYDMVVTVNSYDKTRVDPDLIATVEALGKDASGQCGDIRIIEIPDGIEWEIDDYDGIETVREVGHRW